MDRLAQEPLVDVLFIDGIDDLERERVLAIARARGAWSIHLRSDPSLRLPAMYRQQFLAALPLDADEAKIARMLAAVLAARRSRPTRSSA